MHTDYYSPLQKISMENKITVGIFFAFFMVCQVHATTVNCTETGAGRFADANDTTCQNYTFCVYDSSSSSYIAYNYVCPTTSLFDPNTSKCTTNYVCNVTSSSTTNTTTSVCTADGYVADPDSTDCTTYIECVDIDGNFTETTYPCSNNTYFNPNTTLCESDYNCTTNTNSTDSSTTSFSCTSAGRFANSADTTCQTYYFCVLSTDGTYLQYEYTCPSTSVFSPTSSVCTTSYTCTTT